MATTSARKNLGDSSERVAALYLERNGYRVFARNVRTRAGEIDIVAQDAQALAFVEVKARRGAKFGTAEEAITPRKQIKLVELAENFIAQHPEFANHAWRIDVVAVQLDRTGHVESIKLIKNAVQF